jgi:hypothetical protein
MKIVYFFSCLRFLTFWISIGKLVFPASNFLALCFAPRCDKSTDSVFLCSNIFKSDCARSYSRKFTALCVTLFSLFTQFLIVTFIYMLEELGDKLLLRSCHTPWYIFRILFTSLFESVFLFSVFWIPLFRSCGQLSIPGSATKIFCSLHQRISPSP